jgi:hypothetical protein
MNKVRISKLDDDSVNKQTVIWIDHKQRQMKNYLRRIYKSLFSWRGVWRTKELYDDNPEDVPRKVFNFVTQSLTKPILKTRVSSDL